MELKNKDLKRRLIEISYKHKLSHLGSVLTAVDIIDEIFSKKSYDEKFVLSSGHAGLALYVVLEKYGKPIPIDNDTWTLNPLDAEKIFNHHGVHPDYCEKCHIDCSSGSLGNGLSIAVGMALANRKRNVYCLISDGELAEGSIWEAFRIMGDYNLNNLKVFVNYNGWGAYQQIDSRKAIAYEKAITELTTTSVQRGETIDGKKVVVMSQVVFRKAEEQLKFLEDQDAHYKVLTSYEYGYLKEVLK